MSRIFNRSCGITTPTRTSSNYSIAALCQCCKSFGNVCELWECLKASSVMDAKYTVRRSCPPSRYAPRPQSKLPFPATHQLSSSLLAKPRPTMPFRHLGSWSMSQKKPHQTYRSDDQGRNYDCLQCSEGALRFPI